MDAWSSDIVPDCQQQKTEWKGWKRVIPWHSTDMKPPRVSDIQMLDMQTIQSPTHVELETGMCLLIRGQWHARVCPTVHTQKLETTGPYLPLQSPSCSLVLLNFHTGSHYVTLAGLQRGM